MWEGPDSFNRFSEICSCKTIIEWKALYKRKKWSKPIFPGDKEGHFVDWKKQMASMKKSYEDAVKRGEFDVPKK